MIWLLCVLASLVGPALLERHVDAAAEYRRSVSLMEALLPDYGDRGEAGGLARWNPNSEPITERRVEVARVQLRRAGPAINTFVLASACSRVEWGMMQADDIGLGSLVPIEMFFVSNMVASRAVVQARDGDSAGATDDLLAVLRAADHTAAAPGIDNKSTAALLDLAAGGAAAKLLVHLDPPDLLRLDAALQASPTSPADLAAALRDEWAVRELKIADLDVEYTREETDAALDAMYMGMVEYTEQQRADFADRNWRLRMLDAMRAAVEADAARLSAGELDIAQWPDDRHRDRLGYWYWNDLNPDPRLMLKTRRSASLQRAALRGAIAVLLAGDSSAAAGVLDPATRQPLCVTDEDQPFVETSGTVEVIEDGETVQSPLRVPLFDPVVAE